MTPTPSIMGVDIGGTFTDLVYSSQGEIEYAKSPTTPDDMLEGVRNAIDSVVEDLDDVDYFFHGTTAVINALIERDGAKTGLLTTRGFRDIYEIGRGSRSEPFNMLFEPRDPYVPRHRRLEVDERIDGNGEIHEPLDEESVIDTTRQLADRGVESIAVCYLNSYGNPTHELQTADLIREEFPDLSVSASAELAREWREFERISTAIMNAYVKPLMNQYVTDLEAFLESLSFSGELYFLQSSGGSMSSAIAKEQPLGMVESGPAGGIVGSASLSKRIESDPVLSFDMGGTTAKASLVKDHTVAVTRPYLVGGREGYPSLLPSVDIQEIGSGGGSIAYLDEADALKVGPRSSGAEPGPACYGKGGTEPTVTDAHVVLGRINPDQFLGGEMRLDVDAAEDAIAREVAEPLGMSVVEAAQGILDIANNDMGLMLREESVQRGYDPRNLALVAYGGAGPLHASTIAAQLSIPEVIIPQMAANFSAAGLLNSDVRHERVQTMDRNLETVGKRTLQESFEELESELVDSLQAGGNDLDDYVLERSLELYYEGQSQSHTLTIALEDGLSNLRVDAIQTSFHERHGEVYGFSATSEPIKIQNVRVVALSELPEPELFDPDLFDSEPTATGGEHTREVVYDGEWYEATVHSRAGLVPGEPVTGPTVVEEPTSTTIVRPGDVITKDPGTGVLHVEVNAND